MTKITKLFLAKKGKFTFQFVYFSIVQIINDPFSTSSSETKPVSEAEKNESSTRLKRSADSTEESECQAKRQKTDTDVDSS